MFVLKVAGGTTCSFDHVMKQREVFGMDSCSDQFERNRHMRFKLEDAIELLRPGDFVCSHTPFKTADSTQMLCFSQERFTSLQRPFTQCTLDRDAGNVCHLRDEILLNLRRAS